MTDTTTKPAYGVALHTDEPPTGLRTTYARIPADRLDQIRDAVTDARASGLNGGTDIVIVWGRPGRRPQPEVLTAHPDAIEALRKLLLELDR